MKLVSKCTDSIERLRIAVIISILLRLTYTHQKPADRLALAITDPNPEIYCLAELANLSIARRLFGKTYLGYPPGGRVDNFQQNIPQIHRRWPLVAPGCPKHSQASVLPLHTKLAQL